MKNLATGITPLFVFYVILSTLFLDFNPFNWTILAKVLFSAIIFFGTVNIFTKN